MHVAGEMRWLTSVLGTMACLVFAGIDLVGISQLHAQSFAEQKPPPNYALPASWAANRLDPGASAAVPAGATAPARNARVDVFYVHPTTLRDTTRSNQDVADAATNAWTDASVIARQASVFNACCRVFAPRYRQASFRNVGGDRAKALDLAYDDVARAFDRYLVSDNRGRPFILAGHSQGASLIARLLVERIDGTSLRRRLVAAYVVGVDVAEGDFGRRYKHLTICAHPADTGCVVQWNSVLQNANLPTLTRTYQSRFVARYGDIPGKQTLCVNPLTFERSRPAAGVGRALGAVPGIPGSGTLRPLIARAVAARCEQGLLLVEPSPALDLEPLSGGAVMHYHDFGLFYADIRANAVRRADAYLRAHRIPRHRS